MILQLSDLDALILANFLRQNHDLPVGTEFLQLTLRCNPKPQGFLEHHTAQHEEPKP
jgi:hypothetical protein